MWNKRSGAWYEQEEFWSYYLPVLIASGRPERVLPEVDHILERITVPERGRVLDLGCGIGRHALELARRGYHVTGVDRTVRYLELARARAQSEGLNAEFLEEDMRQFRRANRFDAALSIFTSFGYFDSPEEDKQVLKNVYDSLRVGGAALIDVHGKEVLARTFRERDWQCVRAEGREVLLLEEREILPAWQGVRSRWIFVEDDGRAEFTTVIRLYAATELVRLVEEVGFTEIETFGNMDGRPYDQNADRLVVVGRKR